VSHLARHFGITILPPPPPPDPEPKCVAVSKRLVARFAHYYKAHGRSWNGLRFDGMGCEPVDAEAAELAEILRRASQETRWKIQNHSVRYVG
jgi:hypothetical protein